MSTSAIRIPLSQRIEDDLKYSFIYLHALIGLPLGVLFAFGLGLIGAAVRPPELNEETGTYASGLLLPLPFLTSIDMSSPGGRWLSAGIGILLAVGTVAGLAYLLRKSWSSLPSEWAYTLQGRRGDRDPRIASRLMGTWGPWLGAIAFGLIVTGYISSVVTNFNEGGVPLDAGFYGRVFFLMLVSGAVYLWSARQGAARPEALTSLYLGAGLALGVLLWVDARLFGYFSAVLSRNEVTPVILWAVAIIGGLLVTFKAVVFPRLSFLASMSMVTAPPRTVSQDERAVRSQPQGELAVISHEQRLVKEQLDAQISRIPTALRTSLDPALWAQRYPLGATGVAALVGFLIPQLKDLTKLMPRGQSTPAFSRSGTFVSPLAANGASVQSSSRPPVAPRSQPTGQGAGALNSIITMALGSIVHEGVEAMKRSFLEGLNKQRDEESRHPTRETSVPHVH